MVSAKKSAGAQGDRMDENARYILAIAEKGSISQAAETIHISQSALSQRLKNEESRLGVELFDRTHIPIQPTHAGRIYLEWAKNVVRAESDLKEKLASVSSGARRHLHVGVSAPRCSRIMSEATAEFCRKHPDCELSFFEVGKRELINAAFVNGTIDFAVLTPQQPEPTLYASRPLCTERYVYVAPASWEIPATPGGDLKGVVSLEAIAKRPFIMPTYARRTTEIILSLFDVAPAKPPIVANCISASMQVDLVGFGLGASIVSTVTGHIIEHPELAYYDVEGISGTSYLYYSYRIDRPRSSDEEAFMAIVERKLEESGMLVDVI